MRIMLAGVEKGDVRVRYIPNDLENLQALVGGYIEAAAPVELFERGIQLLVDEEGILKGKQPNLNLFPFFFVGPAMFVGFKGSEFVSLTQDQMIYIRMWLSSLEG